MVLKNMSIHMKSLLRYLPWMLLLLGVDAFAALLLWLADARAFYATAAVIFLFTVLLFAVLCYGLIRLEHKREQAFLDFLGSPDEYHEEMLLKALPSAQRGSVRLLGGILREKQAAYAELQEQWNEHEEYVEAWAHEIKIPLSLLTLLLDNRREELPAAISFKLDHVRNRVQESVDRMLFCARLKSARKDYLFEFVPVRPCIEELLEDYRPLLEEKAFKIQCPITDDTVYTDRRGLRFLLGQLISNSIKYSGGDPELHFGSFRKDDRYILSLGDNGPGVRACDLPYLFEKGFTGDSGSAENRQKATGMGLYLASAMAKDLNLSLEVRSQWGNGFEIQISFPIVDRSAR